MARSEFTATTCWSARSCCRATRSRRSRPSSARCCDAFEYGAPPHGGIALGIDRWIALLTNQVNIREVQAFPKTGTGSDLMLGAPSPVEPAQLAELGLQLAPPKAKPRLSRALNEPPGLFVNWSEPVLLEDLELEVGRMRRG